MILACQKSHGKFSKRKTPPPPLFGKNSHVLPFFFHLVSVEIGTGLKWSDPSLLERDIPTFSGSSMTWWNSWTFPGTIYPGPTLDPTLNGHNRKWPQFVSKMKIFFLIRSKTCKMQNIPVLAALRVLRPWLQTGANGRQKFRFLWHDHDKDKDPNVVLNSWYFIFVSIAKKKQTKTGANPLANSSLACSHCNSSVNWGPTHRNTLSSMRNCSLLFHFPLIILFLQTISGARPAAYPISSHQSIV